MPAAASRHKLKITQFQANLWFDGVSNRRQAFFSPGSA
jgi:hypothetical protein